MKKILTKDLVPGMITAEDVFTISGQLILPENLKLTDRMITRLEFYSIEEVLIQDEASEEQIQPVIGYRDRKSVV